MGTLVGNVQIECPTTEVYRRKVCYRRKKYTVQRKIQIQMDQTRSVAGVKRDYVFEAMDATISANVYMASTLA